MKPETYQLNGTLDYFQGAYAPTIRFYTDEEDTLERLSDVFRWLSIEPSAALDLCACPGLAVSGLVALRLETVVEQPVLPVRKLKGEPPSFCWSNTPDEWAEIGMLFEGMLGGGGGHQYFSDERPDSALIVIAHNEDF